MSGLMSRIWKRSSSCCYRARSRLYPVWSAASDFAQLPERAKAKKCRIYGLAHGTLQRGLRRERLASGSPGLVAVELSDGNGLEGGRSREGDCGLEVI